MRLNTTTNKFISAHDTFIMILRNSAKADFVENKYISVNSVEIHIETKFQYLRCISNVNFVGLIF
jgi:hypothetical protein